MQALAQGKLWEKKKFKHSLSFQVSQLSGSKSYNFVIIILTFFNVRRLFQEGMAEECVCKE